MEQENQCAAAENERGTMKILKGIVVAENERGRVTRDITTRVQSNEMQCCGHVGSTTMKPFVLASNLPDLSSSVSPSLMFHRLSVYGALIHRTAPDDAFGGSDGVKRGPLRCHVPVPELLIKQLNRETPFPSLLRHVPLTFKYK
ncbi:hypothetical protein OIU77_003113 [Salix suchowensis]|uniref:Uncharacterized protein n=1 Tax=Salix suchowensis TaxID=1278906 RepID=A0ABQ9B0U7_9ROSI|nr:hypothetical protein OIU77_003113 [Salix suchowensis]